MKTFKIVYEKNGDCLYTVKAKTQTEAVVKFHRDIGFYSIYSIKEI